MVGNQSEYLTAVKSLAARLLFLMIAATIAISCVSFEASADESINSKISDTVSEAADESSTDSKISAVEAKSNIVLTAMAPVKKNPDVVCNFKATTVSDIAVNLTWDKVENAQGYIIYKYDNAKKTWVRIAKTTNNGDSYKVTKLAAATSYKFAIKAYVTENGKEVSSLKYPSVSAKTFNPAVVSDFKVSSVSSTSVNLSWHVIGSAKGYIVYKYDNSKKTWVRVTKTQKNVTSYNVTNLMPTTSYKFAIKAYTTINGKEISSVSYPTISAKTSSFPVVSKFKAASVTDSTATLTWNKVSCAKGYIIYKYDNSKKTWVRVAKTANNVTSYTVGKLSSNTSYKFAIKAYVTINGKEVSSPKYPTASAKTKKTTIKIGKPSFSSEVKYDSGATHPFNRQTNTLNLSWSKASNAKSYQIFVKGGRYNNWTHIKSTSSTSCSITGLSRATTYHFIVRGVNGNVIGPNSNYISLKTARFDFDQDGWEAMCRIVYHEVGQTTDSMWDRPIVYVADCVSNRYTTAKYGSYNNSWAAAYRNYSNIQSVIYNSGGFMSSYGLACDGATYGNVSYRVKQAVYGATYALTAYKGIKNDMDVYFWCNRDYYQYSSNIAYTFSIPWGGYFNIWRTYWG